MTVQYGWLIYEVSENDYRLGADGLDIEIKSRPPADSTIIEYNQLDLTNGRNSCTIHASVGAVSDLTNKAYSLEERQALWDSAIEAWASETVGWHFYKAVDHIRKDWNKKNPNNRLVSFRLSFDSPEFDLAVSRGHSLIGGYGGNAEYNRQAEDGILEWTEFGKPTYFHCIRYRKNWGVISVDNYLGRKTHNTYDVLDFAALVKNKVVFNEFYLFLPFNTMTESEQKRLRAKELGIWNGERANEPVTRGECAEMIVNALSK